MEKSQGLIGRYGRTFAANVRKLERYWPATMVLMLLAIILLSTLKSP